MMLTLIAWITIAHAAMSPLDRPAEPAQPTVRSEIRRGVDAGVDCATLAPAAFDRCFSAVESRNVQQNRATDAFMLGLNLDAWLQMSVYETIRQNTGEPTSAARYWRRITELQRRLGVDDTATCEAARLKCDVVLRDMAAWRTRP